MRVVDTSAWIEALPGVKVRAELPDLDKWPAPAIVLFELAKWLPREIGEDVAESVEAYSDHCVVADLDTGIALAAAIVYAKAQAHGADVLTCDRNFEDLPGVRFISSHDA